MDNLLSDQISNQDNLFSSEFEYELLDLRYSIFGAKAKIAVQPSSKHLFPSIWEKFDNELILNVDIYNGPLLFDKAGVTIGRGIWYISLDKQANDVLVLKLNESPTVLIKIGLENEIEYKLPIQWNSFKFLLAGTFDPKTQQGNGQIGVDDLTIQNKQQIVKAENINISFTHSNTSDFQLSTDVSEILFEHQSMSEPVLFNLESKSKISLNNKNLSALSNISFKQDQNSKYPVEEVNLGVKLKDANVIELAKLVDSFDQLENLYQQIEWILDEQAEVPEGQDQLWQLQDNIEQLTDNLPSLTNEFLMKNDKPITSFSLNVQHQKERSNLVGEVLALSKQSMELVRVNSGDSFLSLFNAKAKVSLDKALHSYISKQFPINKPNFELTFKQNKLLMQ